MGKSSGATSYHRPNVWERVLNRSFGFLVGLGFGLRHNYLLQVRGRRAGREYSTPVDLLEFNGKRFLVAPRGRTQWVRNAEAAGEIVLRKGRRRERFRLRAIPDSEKPEILQAYLNRFAPTVQRYFPVPAGSAVEAFARLAPDYPAFELLPLD
jgi:deazaflavin-dependent oxidoreductase (nitroreductase family)